ncbi:MAG TPA: type 4a pilus biogenesis protein PilO [Clostridiaceae bacterium]|nr:type 4a pilus biogenesis protein PilO [Clostridiaceae bacterium]
MNNKKLSVPVIVISVFVLLSTFFLVMEIISIKTVIDNINRTEEEIQDLNEKLIYLKGFEKNMEEMLKNLDKLKKALPESPEISEVILTLKELALENSIKINEIRFEENKTEGLLNKLPLNISITGEYFEILEFIDKIKEKERIFTFDSIYIEKDDDTQELTADIYLNTYNLINK